MKKRFVGKKVLVFDLDGTLIDTMKIFADVAAGIIEKQYGMPRKQARVCYLQTSGVPFFKQLEILFPGSSQNKAISLCFEEEKVSATKHINITDEDKESLRELARRGHVLAISSNNLQENVGRLARSSGISFAHVLGYRNEFLKGENHFDYIIQKEGININEILFVADSLSDMKIANECGVDFVGKIGTFPEADFEKESSAVVTIRYLKELYDVV